MSAAAAGEALRAYICETYRRGTLSDSSGEERSIFPAGLAEADGEAIRDLCIKAQATRTLETGLGFGLSTLFFCEALTYTGAAPGAHVAIDPLQDGLFGEAALRSLRAAGVDWLVAFHADSADRVLPKLLTDGEQFDVVLVDGDHHFDNAFVDCFYSVQLLRPGGLLVVDDVWMPAVDLVVRYLKTNLGCRKVASLPSDAPFDAKRPGGGARMEVLRTATEEERVGYRPWDSFTQFAPTAPRWLARLNKRFLRYDS